MELETRIAISVFAAGVMLALVALAGCEGNEGADRAVAIEPCPGNHSTLPVVGTHVSKDRRSILVVGPGQACGFATALHGKAMYVELRKRSEDATDYESLKCYELALKRPLPEAVKTSAISPGQRAKVGAEEVSALLASAEECARPPEQNPSFIID